MTAIRARRRSTFLIVASRLNVRPGGWFNNDRLHESLGDLPPAEFEALYGTHANDNLVNSVDPPD